MRLRRYRLDLLALLGIVVLWAAFFWQILTPIPSQQASFKRGDFSGQFVAFAAYQYDRMSAGEIPLWNPYNNGGLPFVADTQAAVMYPPRLATMALTSLSGDFNYHTLELEAAFHVLTYLLFAYAMMRRMTWGKHGSVFGALVTALGTGFSGFTTSYPLLQLALLEAAIWLPLTILMLFQATQSPNRPSLTWLVFAGVSLGMSWLAGHPQTSFFLTYLAAAFFAYRCYSARYNLLHFVTGLALFGITTFGITAVTFVPGIEYLAYASRTELTFAEKGNGFPITDVVQFIMPHVVSAWSPLYIGIPALILAIFAVLRRVPQWAFWLCVAVIALLLSFGANAPLYGLLYDVVPGLRFFRGQERAAYLVMNSLAILAGLGAVELASSRKHKALGVITGALATLCVASVLIQGLQPVVAVQPALLLSAAVCAGVMVVALLYNRTGARQWLVVLVALTAGELLLTNGYRDAVFDAVPPEQQLSFSVPETLRAVSEDPGVFRIDGYGALGTTNDASIYGLMDIRGISPLFIRNADTIINAHYTSNALAWELFAVKYVTSPQPGFGQVETQILQEAQGPVGAFYLHEIINPRPFAHFIDTVTVASDEDEIFTLLYNPNFDPRSTVILERPPQFEYDAAADTAAEANIVAFAPEKIELTVNTPDNALLSLSLVHYPGWQAQLNGENVPLLRAYGTLSAVEIPAGEHVLTLTFNPLSYQIGAILSLCTWLIAGILGALSVRRQNTSS